jgi:ABC-type multidrug transport system ATPase subunit
MNIRIEKISKQFGRVWALEEVSLELDAGQVVVVLGANGAGKTTLLNCLAAIVAPSRGSIYYDGELFHRGKLGLRRRLMFLPDFPMAFARMNVLQHIAMCVRLYDRPQPDVDNVAKILDQLNILALAGMPLGTMSRGQLYKACLAGLLVVDPELWILDEPMASGMDPMGIAYFKQQARSAAVRGRTVVYTTQILEIAEKFADRVCVLDHGGLRLTGKAGELWGGEGRQSLEDVLVNLRERDVPE